MIKLFRNIRQNLLKEGKKAKYFKYAVGEIVLVVIGILIALQVNNWNENRISIIKKEKLLNALKIEFTSNLTQLEKVLYFDSIVLEGTKRLMRIDPENSIEITSDSMPNWLQNASFRWTFNPINGALRSGISSGQIHLIKNDSLVNLLFGWQDFVADSRENEERCVAAVIAARPIIEKYIRNLDYRRTYIIALRKSRFPSDYQSLFTDPLFEDYLGERYLSMDEALFELKQVKKQNNLILELIDLELNKD
ncbi:DUF6090 family protein [Gaetbulibacter aquiaggeris]|uniref:DUF6090 family protein n=1 Tax=Gaetbulibacter aquiaggeris TaxID=1735373 RepID=A0ABW7MNU9_9FLAO